MIYVRPGTYVENLTLIAGITIASIPGDGYDNLVQIEGSITGTYSGISTISGCKLVATTAGGIILSGGAGTQLYLLLRRLFIADQPAISRSRYLHRYYHLRQF